MSTEFLCSTTLEKVFLICCYENCYKLHNMVIISYIRRVSFVNK
jgi:hypothetical protein